MDTDVLELWPEGEPAWWVADRIHDFGLDVGSLVPDGFEAYARILHPATRDDGDSETTVRWAEVAAANGRTVHGEMQWSHVSGVAENAGSVPGLWDTEPEVGNLPRPDAVRLSAVLSAFTTTPDRAWFCVWSGWGSLRIGPPAAPLSRGGHLGRFIRRRRKHPPAPDPTVMLPAREYHLFAGPVAAAAETMAHPPLWRSANLWWPDDRAWCVATEIDLSTTYVGGSAQSVAAVLAASGLESMAASSRDQITEDRINPPPAMPYR